MGPAEALVAARFLHYAAVLGLFGSALFALQGFGAAGAPATLARRLTASWRVGSIAALVTGILWLLGTAAAMAGDFAAAADPATLAMVVGGTGFGALWAARLGLALVLVALAAMPRPPAAALTAGSAVLLASLALTGHAGAAEGALGWLQKGADALHLLAAGAWLGALAAMGLMLRRNDDDATAASALLGFSRTGSILVAVLVATGLLNSWLILGAPEQVWTTTYGRLLAIKVGLFGLMLGLAALNRFWLAPSFAADAADRGGRLRMTVAAEQVLGLAVIALVAVLGTLDPHA